MPLLSGHDDAATPIGEDVDARAARLGITVDRVLEEYRRIAFSNIRRVVEWDAAGRLTAKASTDLSDDEAAAIAEIVASASSGSIYRIKMHDKKPVLDALARFLDMLPPVKHAHDTEDAGDREMDPREAFIRALDQVVAEEAAEPRDPETEA